MARPSELTTSFGPTVDRFFKEAIMPAEAKAAVEQAFESAERIAVHVMNLAIELHPENQALYDRLVAEAKLAALLGVAE